MPPLNQGPLNFPFPEQLPEQTYPPADPEPEPEPAPVKTGEPPVVTADQASAADRKVAEAINSDAAPKIGSTRSHR